MKNKITLSAVQMPIVTNEVETNLESIEKLTAQIFRRQKSDLVVFPEDCITGPIPDRLDLAMDENSKPIGIFRHLAKKYKTYIVSGSFIKKSNGKYYNCSLLINDEGEILHEYRKINLWHSERRYLTAGNEINCVRTPIGKIGIIICWDISNPEICRELAKQGAEIICCPSYWTNDTTGILERHMPGNEEIFINTICPARAIENEVLLVFANGAGESKFIRQGSNIMTPFTGQTQICAPIIGCAARVKDNSEGFVTYEYDKQIAADSEKIFKIRGDLNS